MTSFAKGLVEAARQAQAIARGEAAPARAITPAEIEAAQPKAATTSEPNPSADSPEPEKDGGQQSDDDWWEEMKKPSRQRNLTPLQRKLLADSLRSFRRGEGASLD